MCMRKKRKTIPFNGLEGCRARERCEPLHFRFTHSLIVAHHISTFTHRVVDLQLRTRLVFRVFMCTYNIVSLFRYPWALRVEGNFQGHNFLRECSPLDHWWIGGKKERKSANEGVGFRSYLQGFSWARVFKLSQGWKCQESHHVALLVKDAMTKQSERVSKVLSYTASGAF